MSFALTLHVGGVKDEHAAYVAQQLFTLQQLFKLDGSDVETNVSAERNRDGQERIYELLIDHLAEDNPFGGEREALIALVRYLGTQAGGFGMRLPLELHAQLRRALGSDFYVPVERDA